MSRLSFAVGFGERPKSRKNSAKLLAWAYSCAQRAQVSLESLGGASDILLLSSVGAGLLLSRLTDAMIEGSVGEHSMTAAYTTVSGSRFGAPVALR